MKKARECDGYLGGDCLSCGNKKVNLNSGPVAFVF